MRSGARADGSSDAAAVLILQEGVHLRSRVNQQYIASLVIYDQAVNVYQWG